MEQVKVDTILIESDMVGKAILGLIPVLNIRKLVVGTAKSTDSLRYIFDIISIAVLVWIVLFLFFGLCWIFYVFMKDAEG